jgi:diaminohydroxyphosphoribosylaminopyrimidine deaminase / 5-amino-6-(5-phosphoribosylamino)uracil reductase
MMQRCLALARQALGQTAPNPLVGAVIVQGGAIVGEGFHPKAGEPHAEVFALRQAGDLAQGATLYVNLEPCSHFGRTPPCADAVIAAGIAKVVVGMVDPNPKVSGSGIARLQQAGIEITVGVEAAACEELNEAFIHRIRHHRPFGILKYAMTLDGKIAATTGHSAWVTGPGARAEVHRLRAECNAVIVGGNTLRRDNPWLTSRQAQTPLRVVMSRSLNLPFKANLWEVSSAPTLVFTQGLADTSSASMREKVLSHLISQGVEVIECDVLTPAAVMQSLYQRGCLTVLWECGGTLAARAIADAAVQKIWAFVAPKLIGGATAASPLGDLGLTQMTDALPVQRVTWHNIGPDLLIQGYLES